MFEELEQEQINVTPSHKQVTLEFYKILIDNVVDKKGDYLKDRVKMIYAWEAADFFLSKYNKIEEAVKHGEDPNIILKDIA